MLPRLLVQIPFSAGVQFFDVWLRLGADRCEEAERRPERAGRQNVLIGMPSS